MRYIRPLSSTSLINDPNLISYWPLDGNTNDAMGSYHATGYNLIYNGSYSAFGTSGPVFNGSSSYITAGDALDMGTGNLTISAWMKSSTPVSASSILCKSSARGFAGRWGIYFDTASTTIRALMEGTASNTYEVQTSYTGLFDSTWHHVVVTYNRASVMSIYIDGVFRTSTSISAAAGQNLNSTDPLYIGAYGNSTGTAPGYFFNGYIDDVAVFNRSLSSIEIAYLSTGESFINNRPLSETRLYSDANLVNYWKLDNNSNDSKGTIHGSDLNIIYGNEYGVFGQGANFNGINGRINLNNIFGAAVPNMTISCWLKDVSIGTGISPYIISQRDNSGTNGQFSFGLNNNGTLFFYDYGSAYGFNGSCTLNVVDGAWHHCAFVKSGGTSGSFYVDGNLINTISGSNITYSSSITAAIGYDRRDSIQYFNGNLDDIAIFTRALASVEVKEIYERDSSLYSFRPLLQTRFFSDDALVSYWKLDGSANDSKGSFGMADTAVSYVPGLFGQAAFYNGAAVSTATGMSTQLSKDSTFTCWIKMNTLPGTSVASMIMTSNVASYSNYWKSIYMYNNAGTVSFAYSKYDGTNNPVAYSTGITPAAGVWYFVCGVQSGTSLQIFVNGVLRTTVTDTTTSIPAYSGFTVGGQPAQSGRYFNGIIEDAAVFSRALSRDEILELYRNTGRGELTPAAYRPKGGIYSTSLVNDSSLVSYWKFDGNLLDSKGSNHGTAVNVSGYDGRYGRFGQGVYSAGGSTNRSVTIASSASLISPSTSLTVCGWVYVTSLVAQTVPISMRYLPDPTSPYNAYLFDIETTNVQFSVTTTGVSGAATANVVLQTNSWQFLTGTYDGSNVKLYINGILSATATASGAINYGSSRELRIADNYYLQGQLYTGYIDDVALFSRALSASEVYSIYNAGESSSLRPFDSVFPLRQDSSVVAYWKFDGSTNDERGSYNGTPTNITYLTSVNGRFGQSAVFNNSSSKILLPNITTGSYSFSCWFKINAISSVDHIIYVQDNTDAPEIRLMITGDNYLRLQVYANGTYQAQLAYSFSDTTSWHHVCGIWASNDARLYLDGTLVSSDNSVTLQTATTVNHSIGWYARTPTLYFNGYIDDAVLFSRPLTSTEVHKIYTHGSTRGYWKLNGSSADFSGNNNHGTDTNITYSTSNGRVGIGAGFNGSSSKIDVGNGSSLQITKSPMTVSAWVKTMPVSAYRGIVSKMSTGAPNYGFLLRFYAVGNVAEFGVSSTGSDYFNVRGKTPIDDGVWHHVVGTYCPGTFLKIYVDGNLERTNTTSIPNAIYNTTGPVLIGASYTTPSEVTSGSIEEVMIEDRVWSESDVRKYYTASRNRNNYNPGPITDGLILYLDPGNPDSYPGTGTTMYDLSGGGRNATWYNSPVHSGTYGGVIQTNGSSSYVLVPPASLNLATTNYTVMAATRYSGATRGRIMAGYSNNWLLGHHSSSVLEYYAEGWINDTAVNDTNWRVYAGTGDITGDKYSLYVNGDPVVLNSTGGSAGPNGLVIAGGYTYSEWSIGETGFVLAYNRVLTQAEIRQNFNYFRNRYNL